MLDFISLSNTIILVFAVNALFALIIAYTAHLKGWKGTHFWFLSLFVTPLFSILILIALGSNGRVLDGRKVANGTHKFCIHCHEILQSAATHCPHCAQVQSNLDITHVTQTNSTYTPNQSEKQNQRLSNTQFRNALIEDDITNPFNHEDETITDFEHPTQTYLQENVIKESTKDDFIRVDHYAHQKNINLHAVIASIESGLLNAIKMNDHYYVHYSEF